MNVTKFVTSCLSIYKHFPLQDLGFPKLPFQFILNGVKPVEIWCGLCSNPQLVPVNIIISWNDCLLAIHIVTNVKIIPTAAILPIYQHNRVQSVDGTQVNSPPGIVLLACVCTLFRGDKCGASVTIHSQTTSTSIIGCGLPGVIPPPNQIELVIAN